LAAFDIKPAHQQHEGGNEQSKNNGNFLQHAWPIEVGFRGLNGKPSRLCSKSEKNPLKTRMS